MKPIFKRLLSGVLSATMTVSAIPIISAHAEESAEPYPYTMFAASSVEGAITVNAGNLCVNGNVATNGTIVSSGNMNINGTRTEHADESMLYVLKKLNYSYFSSENVETYTEDYVLEDLNININNPIDVDGTIELTGNINLNSGIKAVDDVILNGEVKNSNNAVICSETGDINIETSNVNFNGLIYAPYGDIVIDSDNLNLNNVVIIGQTITIDCPNVNANYSNETATLIGNESDIDVELYAMGSYNADVNAIDIEWFTNYTNSSYEVLYSDDNENYTPVATVTDATTYQYLITEDFQKRYFKISLVTNYGEEIESIPFVATKSDSGYEVDFLDSDEDRLPDIYEIMIGTDVNLPDTDGDTLTDYQEIYITETDPTIYDSVVAGISDADADSDEDGLSNSVEITMGTNPQKADTDDDGLSDYDEINIHNTDPAMPDSDNDNVEDGSEIKIGLDPNNPETFGIPDGEYKVSQSISTDSLILSSVNSEESPYELSIDLKTNLDAEKKLSIVQSSYSVSIQNDAMIGASLDISISDECNPEDIVIRYNIKEGYRANTLNLYSEFEELSGLKRLNIFKFDEETRMLLPIDTQFDVENGTLFAEVDELGTYCIMDMEIWLNNLGVTLSIPEVNDTYYTSSPKYSPKKAPSTTTPSWTPTYVNAPIDLVFILQSAGTSSSNFNTEKSVISNFSQKVFNEYEDVRVYIIEFNKDEADFCKPNYLQSSNIQYLTQYSDVVSALGTITYTSESYYCDRGQAFQKLFTNVNLRENADKFIYKFVNGRTKSYTNYDQTSVLNSNLGAYSEIFPSNWYYEDASFGNNIRNRITGRGDLFITLNDDTYSEMIKHLEGKISPERAVYDILLPTNWKKVQLEGEISPGNHIDTDKDSLKDWEEVDTDSLIWNADGSFDLPTFNIATIVSHLKRFNSIPLNEYQFSSKEHYYLPIISDPTMKNSDDDALDDADDSEPLYHDPDPLSFSNISSVQIKYIPVQKVKSLTGKIGRMLAKKWDCDVYISIIKSCNCDDDIFLLTNKDASMCDVFIITDELKRKLNNGEEEYSKSFSHVPNESAAHYGKLETDELVPEFFDKDSNYYYGCWNHNYCQELNMYNYYKEEISTNVQRTLLAITIYNIAVIESANFVNNYSYNPPKEVYVDAVKKSVTNQEIGKEGEKIALKFGDNDFVYGPSAGGKLRALQQNAGGKLLTDMPGPQNGESWLEYSIQNMNNTVNSGNKIHFDLTYMDDLEGVLNGTSYVNSVTSGELNYIHNNWNFFQENVHFYKNGVEVLPPWIN